MWISMNKKKKNFQCLNMTNQFKFAQIMKFNILMHECTKLLKLQRMSTPVFYSCMKITSFINKFTPFKTCTEFRGTSEIFQYHRNINNFSPPHSNTWIYPDTAKIGIVLLAEHTYNFTRKKSIQYLFFHFHFDSSDVYSAKVNRRNLLCWFYKKIYLKIKYFMKMKTRNTLARNVLWFNCLG